VSGFADWITTESVSDRARTPPSELRGDLRVTCTHVAGVGSAIGIAVGIVFGSAAGFLIAIAFGLTGSLGTTWNIRIPGDRRMPVAFGFGGKGAAWAAYFVTIVSLSIKHRVPRALSITSAMPSSKNISPKFTRMQMASKPESPNLVSLWNPTRDRMR
jgi:hypothetical protein